MQGYSVMESIGINSNNGLIITFATDAITNPKVLEIAVKFLNTKTAVHYFIHQENIREDLNYKYTNISPAVYSKEKLSVDACLRELVTICSITPVDYLISNNKYWIKTLAKHNKLLQPVFYLFNKLPVVYLSDYERARVGNGYILHNTYQDSMFKLCKEINANYKTSPKEYKISIEESLNVRGLSKPNMPISTTCAELNITYLNAIWHNILENEESSENYWQKE